MSLSPFIHLRVRSAYSLSRGAVRVPKLIEHCRELNMPAVAVTDFANVFGALEFAQAASKAGVQPIIGAILPILREDEGDAPAATDHLPVLVQDEAGYENLLDLLSRSWLNSDQAGEARLPLSDLRERTGGLLALGGGTWGHVGRLLMEEADDQARAAAAEIAGLFPDRFYLELWRHGDPDEDAIEGPLVDIAYDLGLPLVASNDVHFLDRDMFEAHDALMCIAQGTRIEDPNREQLTPEHWFKPGPDMAELFADLPEAVANTMAVAQRCAYMPTVRKPILPAFPTVGERTEEEELRAQARKGLEERLEQEVRPRIAAGQSHSEEDYLKRLEYELGIIVQMGFPGYFLIVSDFIRWAKSKDIPVGPGRGSGAGSIVAWALRITDLDPLRFGLLFERFLNPERVSMPDFDIDFCQDRRDEVISYVQNKYGDDRVAQIITFGKLQARAVVRDVGRVLGMPYGKVDRLSKLIPNNPANPVTLQQAIDGEELLRQMRREDDEIDRLLSLALKLEGLYRHASTHAAGVVIGDRPLAELVALYRDPRSTMPVTQFNMKYVELAGLVKFDFLGLKTLTVLNDACKLIGERKPVPDLLTLPLDDEKSFQLLSQGRTSGVFQLEGAGMRDTLRRLQPNRFEDIIAVVALYRPGPMENIPSYILRKRGREEVDTLHPALAHIVQETYGIIIYQEQVMQIAQTLSGYSLGAADLLRRAMGKKIKAEMAAQRERFVEGAVANGVDEAQASSIFDLVDKFAGYGFNKSHAAAYALVAYQTAYLKANHPVEFMAALMTHDMQNSEKLAGHKQELNRLNVALLPPDVNASYPTFGVEEDKKGKLVIRYALAALKGVGSAAMESLVAERERGGPFKDLTDLADRMDPKLINRRQIEIMIKAGALDSLNHDRATLLANVENILRRAMSSAADKASDQVSLFGGSADAQPPIRLAKATPWSQTEQLAHELEAIGFYLSAHPLDRYALALRALKATPIAQIEDRVRKGANRIVFGGILLSRQEKTTSRGSRMCFARLSDSSGLLELTLFQELLVDTRDLLDSGKPLMVVAEARLDNETVRLSATAVEPLDEAAARADLRLQIVVHQTEALSGIGEVLTPGEGRSRIELLLDLDEQAEVRVDLPHRYAVSPQLVEQLESMSGIVAVNELVTQ